MNNTFLSARWENLIMANYEVDPTLLEPYLPKGLELDFYEDTALVSLVGFMFKKTNLFNIPVPFFGTFEEINLRFYVKRVEGNSIKRGVVFIKELVPYPAVAWLANILYKEHYTVIPTNSVIQENESTKRISYQWEMKTIWNHFAATAKFKTKEMQVGSLEEFIFEHYYGYTKLNEQKTQEYQVYHPRWLINEVLSCSVFCDFKTLFGKKFSYLAYEEPHSVIMAEGSEVTVGWKRSVF